MHSTPLPRQSSFRMTDTMLWLAWAISPILEADDRLEGYAGAARRVHRHFNQLAPNAVIPMTDWLWDLAEFGPQDTWVSETRSRG